MRFQSSFKQVVWLGLAASLAVVTLFVAPSLSSESSSRLVQPLAKKNSPDVDKNSSPEEPGFKELPPWGYNPPASSENSEKGQAIYQAMNCRQCHSIQGSGGEVGPALDGIGAHRGQEWLMDRLMDPEKQVRKFSDIFGNRPSAMPHPGLTRRKASQVVQYLLTLPEPDEGFLVATHGSGTNDVPSTEPEQAKKDVSKGDAVYGARLFYDLRCYTCHSTDGSKDRFGPDLSGVSDEIKNETLKRFLRRTVHSRLMKDQTRRLTEQELEDLRSFLLSIPDAEKDGSD